MSHMRLMWSLLMFTLLTGCAAGPVQQTSVGPPSHRSNQTGSNQGSSASRGSSQGSSSTSSTSSTTSNPSAARTAHSSTQPPKPKLPTYPVLSFGAQNQNVLKLQKELALLHYLPLTFTSTGSGPGTWTWTYANTPPSLKQLFIPGTYTVFVEGAVMSFERRSGLAVDGVAGPQVWQALTTDIQQHRVNPYGYSYVYVTKTLPERLTLWDNGQDVLVSAANTGIAQSPTPNGTWPVYLRYQSQTMSGTNPNGTHYSDPGVPFINYFYQGDAVHGFVRSSYGYPQSLGCVELPIPTAQRAYSYIHYGTLVTVAG